MQVPIMIGHIGGQDYLPEENKKTRDNVKVIHRNKRTCKAMVNEYATFLNQQHETVKNAKHKILEPILKRLEQYKRVHEEHFSRPFDGDKEKRDIMYAWQDGLLGMLESSLLKLISRYVVFSFNGSR